MAASLDVDNMIFRLLNTVVPLVTTVKDSELITLTEMARKVLLSQPSLIEVQAPINICGDIHGQFRDLLQIFGAGGFPPLIDYLFLGDYVDRGHQSLECISLLFCFKIKYPRNFYILRGNHECAKMNRAYGFLEECNRRYNSTRLWESFQSAFAALPFTGLVAGRILCMHGGLSPELKSLDQLRQIHRPTGSQIPPLPKDLLWSDPDKYVMGWKPSPRGVSYLFGEDVVHKMINVLNIDLIVRAHEVVQNGFEFFANRRLVTIFSAPNYNGQFTNAAAIMCVDEGLVCTFQVIRPVFKTHKLPPPAIR